METENRNQPPAKEGAGKRFDFSLKNILRWLYKNITSKQPWLLLIVSALLTLAAVWIASGITFSPRLDNLLPQDLELVQEFNRVLSKTGNTGPLVVVLEGLRSGEASTVIDRLAKRFQSIKQVYYVDSQIPVRYLKNRQLLFANHSDLKELRKLVEGAIEHSRNQMSNIFGTSTDVYNPSELQDMSNRYKIFDHIQPYHRGISGERYYIFIQPVGMASNTGFTRNFVGEIESEIDQSGVREEYPHLEVRFTGSMITRLEENRMILNDLERSAVVAMVLVILILYIYNGSFLSVALLLIPLITSLSLTFAFTRIIIGHVNIISGFLLAILTGLGINYGIHLYIRFKQELRKEKSIPEAAELVAVQVGRSGIIAMATTISVFSLLMLSDFKGFSEFGAIATIGILCAFTSYFFLFPALVLCADQIRWLRKPRARLFYLRISNIYSTTPIFLVILFLLLLVSSMFLIPEIKFEHDFQKLRGESPAADFETETMEDFGYAFSPTVIMTPNKDHLFEIHRALQSIKSKYGRKSTIGAYHSLNLVSLKEYESKKQLLNHIREILIKERDIIEISLGTHRYRKLKSLVEAPPFDEQNIPPHLTKRFTAGDEFLLLLFSPADKNFFNAQNIFQLDREIKELKALLAKKGIPISVLNENLLAAAILSWVQEKGPQTLLIAMGVVFLILLWDFRSLRLAFKTFLPLFTGLALTGALMSVFNIKLNYINIVMLPSIVGIMIDHCVYLGHHILDYSRSETIKSVKETGSAIILSALTSLSGYASLNIANHAGVKSIAPVVEIGIILCTVCALFMLPVLFEMGAHKSPNYKGPLPDTFD
ncbi:MAG: MMPL family transporter [Nitrospinaceae bacterium]|nr:MMPL family transporter [Nitrospinaceae bacterium]NIT84296.1 MMPL family transporter [Nitrospinaceae bacterium]NIY17742.1 MMPL family transporter [Nitrospinaceae bacterium]